MAFNLMYWTTISSEYFLESSLLEKCGERMEKGCFSGSLLPDGVNSA